MEEALTDPLFLERLGKNNFIFGVWSCLRFLPVKRGFFPLPPMLETAHFCKGAEDGLDWNILVGATGALWCADYTPTAVLGYLDHIRRIQKHYLGEAYLSAKHTN